MLFGFNDQLVKEFAQFHYKNGEYYPWEMFKEECESAGYTYGSDFDEAAYDVYFEEYKRICLENNNLEWLEDAKKDYLDFSENYK